MKPRLIALLLIAAAFAGCESRNDSCVSPLGVATTNVSGPETAAVNETVTLDVSYKIRSKCGDFQLFYEIADGNTKTITTTISYDSCGCDDTTETTETQPYTFKAATAGVYTLKFKITDSTFITHTITVS